MKISISRVSDFSTFLAIIAGMKSKYRQKISAFLSSNKAHYLVLFLWSSIFLLYRFNSHPMALALDELEFAKIALMLDYTKLSAFVPWSTGHGTLYFYIINVLFKLFGMSNMVLRLPALLSAYFVIFLIYQNLKMLGASRNLAFLAGVLLASERVFFQFGRFAFEGTFLIALEMMSLYFLFRFNQSKKMSNLLLSSVFAGLCFYSYTPGRFWILVPVTYLFLKTSKNKINSLRKGLLYLIVFFVVIIPFVYENYRVGDERVRMLAITSQTELNVTQKLALFGVNVGKVTSMWFAMGDTNGRHNYVGKAIFNRLYMVIFLVGIATLLRKKLNLADIMMLAIFFTGLAPTLMVLPSENPNYLRILPAMVGAIWILVVGFDTLIKIFNKIVRKYLSQLRGEIDIQKIRLTSRAILILLIIIGSIWNVRTYFYFQNTQFRQGFELRVELRNFRTRPLPPLAPAITNLYPFYKDE